jgi:hypothetical protein
MKRKAATSGKAKLAKKQSAVTWLTTAFLENFEFVTVFEKH